MQELNIFLSALNLPISLRGSFGVCCSVCEIFLPEKISHTLVSVIETLELVRNEMPEASASCAAGVSNGPERVRTAVPEPRRGRSDSMWKEQKRAVSDMLTALVIWN